MLKTLSNDGKIKKKRKIKRKKIINNTKEMDSEEELVRKRLTAKFKQPTKEDGLPCLRINKKDQMVVKNSEKHDILLKKSQESQMNRLNQVDCSEVTITTRWKCALCQQRTLRSVLGDLFGPYFIRLNENYWPTHLAKKPQKMNKQNGINCDVWLHGPCALSAPGVFLVGNHLAGLQSKIHTFWRQHCAVCSKEGATIDDRGKHYHYPCALQKNIKPL